MIDRNFIQTIAAIATVLGTVLNVTILIAGSPNLLGVVSVISSIMLIFIGGLLYIRYIYFGSTPVQLAGGEWSIKFERTVDGTVVKPIAQLERTRELRISRDAPRDFDAVFGIEDDERAFLNIGDKISPKVSIKKHNELNFTDVDCVIAPDRLKYVKSTIKFPEWVHQNGGKFTLKENVTLLNSFDSRHESYTISIVRPFHKLSVCISFGEFEVLASRVRIKRGSTFPHSDALVIHKDSEEKSYIQYDIKRPRVGDDYVFEWEWELK